MSVCPLRISVTTCPNFTKYKAMLIACSRLSPVHRWLPLYTMKSQTVCAPWRIHWKFRTICCSMVPTSILPMPRDIWPIMWKYVIIHKKTGII